MSPSVTIRPAELRDILAITAIYAEAVRFGTATFELDPPAEAEMIARFEALVGRGYPYLVAEERAALLGYAYAGPYRARPAYRFTVEDSVYLAPDARGRGIGGALLAELVAASSRLGFRQMIAIIGDSANHASMRLHAAAGFAMVGTIRNVGWKFGRWLDTVVMQRELGPGSGVGAEPAA